MKRIVAGCMLALAAAGCCNFCEPKACEGDVQKETITVTRINDAITLDGKMDEAVWATLPEYTTRFINSTGGLPESEQRMAAADEFEAAYIKVAYDDKYIYFGVKIDDDDVLSFVTADQDHLYRNSDVMEFFIASEDEKYYWELYSTPNNHKSSFFFPAGGMAFMEGIMEDSPIMPGYEVCSTVQGKLNDQRERDEGWTTEVRIPLEEINRKGVPFAPGQNWRIQVTRYNFSRFLYTKQFSSYPTLPMCNFHLRTYYAPVIFK